ncbi:MAG: dTDP-glucose 4,6-dehydratase [Deferribacteres bacterium]|nr:dTDP-glucose 4,6-dehydratase [Deferribacteres bacterium]
MKILATGAAGFIGSEFVKQALERGYDVCVVDKLTYAGDLKRLEDVLDKVSFYRADVTNKEFVEHIFERERPDVVVHWAAESHVDRSILDATPFLDTNIKGTFVMLDTAKKFGVEKFVNISTDEVYGELGESGSFTETDPLNPNSPYSVSKTSADMLGRAFYRTYGFPVVTVRPSNNYGPWQYPEKLIPVVILKALYDEPVPLYGRGENVREWLFVADCAQAVLDVVAKGEPGEVYNVGSGEERRNIEVVKAILDIMGKPHDLITFVKDRPGHDFRYSLDTSKIESELGWKARVKFEEGIELTVKWYLDNRKWLEEKRRYLEELWSKVYR